MINKRAQKIGTIKFVNGNMTDLYIDYNRNTGEPIVWQQLQGARARRTTGRNIGRLVAALDEVLECGDGAWAWPPNERALRALRRAGNDASLWDDWQ